MEEPSDHRAGGDRLAGAVAVALDETTLEQLRTALSDQFTALYDHRPVDPSTALKGDLLTFAFQGGLSRGDELLLEGERSEQLCRFRDAFLTVIAPQLEEVVTALAPVEVLGLRSSFDPTSGATECVFQLARSETNADEERQALLNWSEQVRRNARTLRKSHREAREAHARLRDRLRAIRESRGPHAPQD
jgi:hypothetical protein